MTPPAERSANSAFRQLVAFSLLLFFIHACSGGTAPEPRAPLDMTTYNTAPIYKSQPGDFKQHTFTKEGKDFDPDISPTGTHMVFASTCFSYLSNIYIKAVDGTVLTELTHDRGNNRFPVFSPDGGFIAFASDRYGNWDIFLMKLATPAHVQRLTHSPADDLYPSWSPDGTRIVYCSISGTCPTAQLAIYDLRTRSVSYYGEGLFPDWSPTGDVIAFQKPMRRGEQWYGIWTLDLTQGNRLTQLVASEEWAAVHPAWSPDGKKIAFATVSKSPSSKALGMKDEADDIWVIGADGSGLMQITYEPSSEHGPTWSPDDRIYFASNREGPTNIWSIKVVSPEELMPP